MTENTDPAELPLTVAKQLFCKYLPKKVAQLESDLREIHTHGWHQEGVFTLKQHLEQLQNLAKDFSHDLVDMLIQKLSDILTPLLQSNSLAPSEDELTALHNTIKKLQEAISVYIINEQEKEWEKPITPRHQLLIGLLDKQLTEEISQQIKYFGYTCIAQDSVEKILKIANKAENTEKLGAIILDTAYCDRENPSILQTVSEKIPIVFISKQGDVATRIFAVQAGGQAYFVQPLEFTSLIEKIDQLVMPVNESSPYRILVIEDSFVQASIVKKHLEEAEMITEVLVDPLKINETLTEFQPELILLDLYMPLCSGIDLAKVIRQQEPFVSIPIVYLSAEDDTNKQLNAMRGGGDDFLTKHITPQHLIDVVTTRVQRSRTLRSGMILDSLTGLLNHTRVLEQLDLEIARAKRNKTPLSFAMIDLDFFKTVNDSHGHPVGDRVIKGLTRLLKQRLRKIDSVGRYGGEEFAVILPQTQGRMVYIVLDEIRRSFSKLLHRSQDPLIEFSATFSAGLAQLSQEIDTVEKLVHVADKALYLAKERGRNCIVFYNEIG